MDNIYDWVIVKKVRVLPLAETLTGDVNTVRESIRHDYTSYINSPNRKVYALSSFVFKKMTLSDKKLRKLGINLYSDDVDKVIYIIRNKLRHYMMKCLKYFNGVIHPELGDKGRLHFHGYYYGSRYYFDKLEKYWRRNFGFCDSKPISGLAWFDYCDKQTKDFKPIVLRK